jgi:hypothetical protein
MQHAVETVSIHIPVWGAVVLTTATYEGLGDHAQGAMSFFVFPLELSTTSHQSVDTILIE